MLPLPPKNSFYHCPHCKRTRRAVKGPTWIEVEFCHDDGGTSLIHSWACPSCLASLNAAHEEGHAEAAG